METNGESSSATPISVSDKPVIVRVKRKVSQSPLDTFWLEINERPCKRTFMDFENLSISDSVKNEDLKTKKVLVRHVETTSNSEATIDILQPILTISDAAETKSEERKRNFKKDNKHDQLISKARQQQELSAKNARFEQMWRSRKGNKEAMHDEAVHDMCRFYDVLRVDAEETSNEEHTSLEDQRILASYLPLLKEFIPNAVEEIESDVHTYMSTKDDYVYDYYTVNDEMHINDMDASSHPFPLVQVEDDDFCDGLDESEYDSEDSNAEGNPLHDYPDEMSEEDEGEGDEEEDEDDDEEKDSNISEESESDESSGNDFVHDLGIDYNGYHDRFDLNEDDNEDGVWSYR